MLLTKCLCVQTARKSLSGRIWQHSTGELTKTTKEQMCNAPLALNIYLFAGGYFACVIAMFCGHISLCSHTIESTISMGADCETRLLYLLISVMKERVVCGFFGELLFGFREGGTMAEISLSHL